MRAFLLVFSCLTVLFFAHLSSRPLSNPDEGRYASIGRDMLASGDWMTPRLNGLIYFEKPPLAYWSIALGQKIFGESHLGVRFFNALYSLLTCFVLYCFCRKFLSRNVGLWAAFIYGTSGLAFGMSQVLTIDNTLTFFLTTTLVLFASGFLEEDAKASRRCFLWAYVFMALTVLTKGLIGIVFPGLIGLPWLFYTGYFRKIPHMYLGRGLLIFLLIVVPWHVYVQHRHPCFWVFYFWHEHFERYLTTVHNRVRPFYFLINAFLLGLMPWLFFLPRSLWVALKAEGDRKEKQVVAFSIIWAVGIVLFFAQSKSQLIPYVLPAISGISIVLAYGFSKIDLSRLRVEYVCWAVIFLLVSVGLVFVPAKYHMPIPRKLMWGVQGFLFVGSLTALWLVRKRPQMSFYTLMATTLLLYGILPACMAYFQRLSGQQICQAIRERSPEKVDVFCAFGFFNDLPFYLKQPVGTIDCVPEEHTLGYKEESCERYLQGAAFLNRWQEDKRCYVVVRHQEKQRFEDLMAENTVYRLTQDPHFILYSNRP